jgi:PKD repeat protein
LQFELHAFRDFGFGGCGTADQRVNNNSWTVTVHHVAAPTCAAPSGLTINGITSNSANISWTSGGASNWQIEYGPTGFVPGTGTLLAVSSNPFALAGLNVNTEYELRVRDSCSITDVSFWTAFKTFRTKCLPVTAPWTEDFEGSTFTTPIVFNGSGAIDPCFKRNANSDLVFSPGPPLFTPFNTGPSGDHTTGSGKYIFSEMVNFVFTTPITAQLKTPSIDLSGLTTPEMTLWYHMFGGSIGDFQVAISANGGPFAVLNTVSGQQQTSTNAAWTELTLNLSAYANDTVVLRFRHIQNAIGNFGHVAFDDISVYEQPTCPKPSALTSPGRTETTIDLSWTTGGAANWQIEYGPQGFTPGSGTIVNASSNPFTLTGLNPGTFYDVRLRDSCGMSDVSLWTPISSFRTNCSTITAPWTEDFEAGWTPGVNFNDVGDIDICWGRNAGGDLVFVPGPPPFTPFNTGPSGDHTTGSGTYAFSEQINFGPAPFTAQLRSPRIDLGALTSPELSFWYHMFGGSIGDLQVAVSANGGPYSVVSTTTGQQQTASTSAWQEAIVDLSAYANDTVRIRFRSIQSTFGNAGHVAVDDISIYEQPTCAKPTNLAFVSNTTNSITMDWTTGGASNWQVEYGPQGFTPGSGTVVATSTNPFTLNGLNASTTYDIYVQDSCGIGDVSFWVGPVAMATACGILNAPVTENFDGAQWTRGPFFNSLGTLDTCWDRTPINTSFFYKVGPPIFTGGSGADVDHTTGTSSGKYVFTESQGFGGAGTPSLKSPSIDLGPLGVPELSFWYHMFGNDIGDLEVKISTNGGGSFTSLLTITGQQQSSSGEAWKESIIDLTAYANDTVIVEFIGSKGAFGGFQSNICIDDFDIHEKPTCAKPSNLALDFIWLDNVTVSWTSGGATSWDIEYGSPGFTPGSGTVISTTTNPTQITGLSPNTVYDVYVRDNCGGGDVSIWVGPLTVKTACSPAATPYTEDFSGTSFSPGPFFNDTGSVDPCWRRDNLTDYVWKGGPPTFAPFNTGPGVDHTTGLATGKYAFTLPIGFFISGPRETSLYSELVDVSSLISPELSFWYHMFGNNITSLEVLVSDDGVNWTSENIQNGEQQTGKTDAWKEGIVNLSSYGDTVQVQFKATAQAFGNAAQIAIDDIGIDEAPSCPKPQNLQLITTTNSSISIDWTPGGTATNWDIEYGAPGFTPGSGTIVNVTSNPATITGLTANTSYAFYVRDSCNIGDVSPWIGPVLGRTDCLPTSAPWTEDFEGSTFALGIGFNPGTIDGCWDRDSSNFLWAPGQNGTTTFGTGPDSDHTSGTGKYLYSESSFGFNQNTRATVETQLIDLSPLTVPELSFWYHMFGPDIDSLILDISDGSTWTNEFSLSGAQQNSNAAPWTEVVVNMSSYANDTVKLRFTAVKTNSFSQQADMAIDDLDIHEQPSCPQPSALSTSGVTANSITLSWTTGGATNWQIEYGPIGFSQGAGTIINTNTNPHLISGLNSSTSYDFYLRDSCSTIDQSAWIGPFTVTTSCLPTLAPYTENFDGSNYVVAVNFNDTGEVASCWSRDVVDYFWTPGPPQFVFAGTGPSGDHTSGSGQYMYTDIIGFGGATPFEAILETPEIDLSALTDPQLTFWYHMFGTDIGDLDVDIDNGSGYTNLVSFSGQQQTSQTAAWKESIVSLSAYVNDTVRIRFKGTIANFGFQSQAAIDDIEIDEAPACPKPQNLQVTSINSNSATLNWTTGGATNWQIEYGAPGFTPGSGTLVSTSTNPITINGLTPNTQYDFYVRDSCGAGSISDWFGPLADTTDCSNFTAPFTENFDGSNWITSNGFNSGSIDQCWSRSASSGYFWTSGSGATPSFNTGPNADHTSGSGKYAYTEGFSNVNSTELTSPSIDVSSLTTPELRFWYHMFGTNIQKLEVEVFDGLTWTLETTITGQQQTTQTDAWQEQIVSLAGYTGSIQVRFKAFKSGFGTRSDIAIDDFWIGEAPTCAAPSGITTISTTATSIELSWSSGGATMWQLRYRVSGSTGPFTIEPVLSKPYTVTGLNPSTTYEFFVQDSCGMGDVSFWIGPYFESTLCGIVTAPWTESFDGGSWVSGSGFDNGGNQIDPCWTRNTAINQEWGTRTGGTTTPNTGPSGAFSGNKYIYRETSFGGAGTASITSPEVFIPTSILSPKLYFHYHMFGGGITELEIELSTGGAFTSIYTKTGAQQTSSGAAWTLDSVDLTAYSGDTVQLRVVGVNTGFQGDMAVDEFSIKGLNAPCLDPTNLTVTNIGTNSMDVNWTSVNGNSQIRYWELVAGPPGSQVVNATSPTTLNNLQPNTDYVIEVYDSCGTSNLSGSLLDTITTDPCPVVTAGFNFTTNILNASFTSTSTNADSLHWTFDGVSTSSLTNPTHTYVFPGTYNVQLIAFNDCGTTDTIIQAVQVCDSLKANFTYTKSGDTVNFDASSSTGALTYEWDLGNGTDTTLQQFAYKYPNSGNYTVTLKVKNACGDSATFTDNVQLCLTPVADWSYTIISSGGGGMQVQFDASNSQNATSYQWDFGDGNTNNTSAIPIHTYVVPSLLYLVTLKVENPCGESDTKAFRLNQIGLEELTEEQKLHIYPNPADDRIVVEWESNVNTPEGYEVYDMTGKKLQEQTLSEWQVEQGKFELKTNYLPNGAYILKMTGKNINAREQFVVQH